MKAKPRKQNKKTIQNKTILYHGLINTHTQWIISLTYISEYQQWHLGTRIIIPLYGLFITITNRPAVPKSVKYLFWKYYRIYLELCGWNKAVVCLIIFPYLRTYLICFHKHATSICLFIQNSLANAGKAN